MRLWLDLKNLLVEQLGARGVSTGFDVNGLEEYSVVVAPYEADPTCVWVADQVRNSCIFSPDGDLLVYPFADSAPVCQGFKICTFFASKNSLGITNVRNEFISCAEGDKDRLRDCQGHCNDQNVSAGSFQVLDPGGTVERR